MHMAAQVQPLTKPPRTRNTTWSALASHYKTVSKLQLRQLFADDPQRGERLAVEVVGLYLDYSKNRVTDERCVSFFNSRKSPACGRESTPCSTGRKSTSPRSAQSCTLLCVRREAHRLSLTERTWCLKFMPCSTGWRIFPTVFEAVNGKDTPA